jgi:hypothetical protein
MTSARGNPIVAVAAAAALAGAIAVQAGRDRAFPRAQQEAAEILYVRSGPALDRMALGYDALLADVYWIRALQHYGGNHLKRLSGSADYRLLYPLLDIATSLDPYFNIAYRFGAIFLSEGYPEGPARPDQAVALLRKGIAARPGRWQYYHDIGFVYYWHIHDNKAAAEWIQRAAAQPGAPNWLGPLAATMLVKANDRASARALWRQVAQAQDEWLRRAAFRALLQIDALDIIDRIQPLVAQAPPPPGTPHSWAWLVQRGVLRGIPADPTGTPFVIEPATGRVTVSDKSPLYPLPNQEAR